MAILSFSLYAVGVADVIGSILHGNMYANYFCEYKIKWGVDR